MQKNPMAAGSGKPVATYRGNDSGSTCPTPCQVPPNSLSGSGKSTVFVNNVPVMVSGDVLSPSTGKTCNDPSSPCTAQRVVQATGTVFVNQKPIAHIGDILNTENKIKIVSVTSNVYAN